MADPQELDGFLMGKAYQNWDENWGYPYDFFETPTLGAVRFSRIHRLFAPAACIRPWFQNQVQATASAMGPHLKGVPTKEAEAK